MDTLNTGDVVQLKCGSRSMVIHSIDNQDNVLCHWHNSEGNPCSAFYLADMLQRVAKSV